MYKVTILFSFDTELYFKKVKSFQEACAIRAKFLEYVNYDPSYLHSVEVKGESFSFRISDIQIIMITKE